MFVTFYINFFALIHLAVGPQFAPKDVKKFRLDHKIDISTQNAMVLQLIELDFKLFWGVYFGYITEK